MASTTAGLSNLMSTYYDKMFLERAELTRVYDVGATRKLIPANEGKTVIWNRLTPLASATTALTEATNPTAVDMTSTQVSTSLAPYGNYTKVGQLFSLTSIDVNLEEHLETHIQNMQETLDDLIEAELSGGGTEYIANSVAAVSDIAASDTLDGADIRGVVRALKVAKAPTFGGSRSENDPRMAISANHYGGIIPTSVTADLRADSEWLDAHRYVTPENIKNGLIGRLHGVEFFETNNETIAADAGAGNVDVYTTYIFGREAYGEAWHEQEPGGRIFVKTPGPSSTDNPLDLFSTVGWRMNYATKVLNSAWVQEVKSASSFGAN